MANTSFWLNNSSASGTTDAGETNTFTVTQGTIGCWLAGTMLQNNPFDVNGTLVINLGKGSSLSLGGWNSANYDGARISAGGVVQVNGSGGLGVVDSIGSNTPKGFFNIAGNTVNNGTININNFSVYNYKSTSTITGSGTINLTDVTLATDTLGSKYCYWNTTFTNISGQTINLQNSQISFGTQNGTGSISDVTINCSGGGNYIGICAGIYNNVSGLRIRGFGNGDIIDLGYVGQADWYTYDKTTGILTVSTYYPSDSGPITVDVEIDIGLGYDPSGFQQVPTYTGPAGLGGDKGLQYLGAPPCYLSGTLIETDRGLVPVEDITTEDRLVTYNNGQTILRPVVWTGKTRVKAHHSPVIIRQGALAENVPFLDLHITEEHCLFFDGRFVPARMLVNGHSIVYDTLHDSYDVYHVELDTHSVISANGVLSESFLDTGQMAFEGRKSRGLSWDCDAAAALCTDRDFVEPLFRRIAARVPGLIVSVQDATPGADAGLALLVNGKTQIMPARRNGNHIVFTIKEPIHSLSILAEAVSPSTVIGPFVDDRRMLGALVGDVHLFTPEGMITYKSHLDRPALKGWHDKESPVYRWTGAQAELPDIRCHWKETILSLALHS